MASPAIFLTIVLQAIIASASGFKIEVQTIKSEKLYPSTTFTSTTTPTPRFVAQPSIDYRNQPIAGYPKVPPPNAQESGGNEFDLLPPFEDTILKFDPRRSIKDVRVDPKTGYSFVAQPSWKHAGGNEENLEPPFPLDPKTGYPLVAKPHWKDAGGDGEIIALPLEDSGNFGQEREAVDPKTGYPLKANPSWKDAGGNEQILDLPLEDLNERSGAVDPKTGYPLVAQDSWKHAGGDGEILELPLEESDAVDPKTGYPLMAQPSWKDAGGNADILELPLEEKPDQNAVDPETGYPLTAQLSWKDAGGNGDILQLPLDDAEENDQQIPVDPKTGYPLIAQKSWKDAGGNEDILQPPLASDEPEEPAVDSLTGYPLVAQPGWKDAGGNGDILDLPFKQPVRTAVGNLFEDEDGRFHIYEIFKLTELQPPDLPEAFSNPFLTGRGAIRQNQKQSSIGTQQFDDRPVEHTYTYTGPKNVIVTVTQFLSRNMQERPSQQNANPFNQNQQKSANLPGNSGVPIHVPRLNVPQKNQQNFSVFKRQVQANDTLTHPVET